MTLYNLQKRGDRVVLKIHRPAETVKELKTMLTSIEEELITSNVRIWIDVTNVKISLIDIKWQIVKEMTHFLNARHLIINTQVIGCVIVVNDILSKQIAKLVVGKFIQNVMIVTEADVHKARTFLREI